jgi:hypothetical protein
MAEADETYWAVAIESVWVTTSDCEHAVNSSILFSTIRPMKSLKLSLFSFVKV